MFNIPNLLTASNLLCGVTAIICLLTGRWDWACYLIFAAAIFDFFDGFLARKLNQMSELGKQLDSLADMVTFGVAPGILVFSLLVILTGTPITHDELMTFHEKVNVDLAMYLQAFSEGSWGEISFIPFVGLVIPFFSLFRLAKFNIDTRQTTSFIGLPTPANTLFFTAFPLIWQSAYASNTLDSPLLNVMLNPWVICILAVGMSLLLVAELPLFALKFKNFKWKGNEVRFVFLGASIVLFLFLLVWAIPFIILLYIGLALIENKRKISNNEI